MKNKVILLFLRIRATGRGNASCQELNNVQEQQDLEQGKNDGRNFGRLGANAMSTR